MSALQDIAVSELEHFVPLVCFSILVTLPCLNYGSLLCILIPGPTNPFIFSFFFGRILAFLWCSVLLYKFYKRLMFFIKIAVNLNMSLGKIVFSMRVTPFTKEILLHYSASLLQHFSQDRK